MANPHPPPYSGDVDPLEIIEREDREKRVVQVPREEPPAPRRGKHTPMSNYAAAWCFGVLAPLNAGMGIWLGRGGDTVGLLAGLFGGFVSAGLCLTFIVAQQPPRPEAYDVPPAPSSPPPAEPRRAAAEPAGESARDEYIRLIQERQEARNAARRSIPDEDLLAVRLAEIDARYNPRMDELSAHL